MGIVFKNNAKTTLASGITDTATSATVVDGSVFPSLGAGEYFFCTFDNGTQNEIVKVTARSSNTLTIVRAQDNTTARSFLSGHAAELRVTAGVLENIQENIAAKSANQTIYSTTTASSATSYDIGIDPGVEANASVFLDGVYQHHDTFSFSGSTLTFDAAPVDGTALEVIVDNLINLQSSNLSVDTFTAADVGGNPQTDFTLSDVPGAETNLIVFVDGVFQNQDSYTFSNNTLTMTDGVTADRVVTVYIINPVNIGTPSDGTITSAKLSGDITFPGDITVTGDVAFDSPTFVVDNANSRVGIGTAAPSTLLDIVGDVKMSADLTVDTSTLHVDSVNNRVGVGTTNPSSPLEVNGTITIGTGTGTYQAGALGYSDSNWGFIYRPPQAGAIGAHNFEAFNGDDIMVLTESGSVGIGTNSPVSIGGHTGVLTLYGSNATALVLKDSVSEKHLRLDDGNLSVRNSVGDTHLMVLNGGNVGIATDNPAYPLQVRRAGGAGSLGISVDNVGTTDRVAQYFAIQDDATGNGSGHAFYSRAPSSTTDTLTLMIDENQRVGIGTSSPSEKLEVAGNIFVNTSGNPNLTVKTSGAGNNPNIRIQADTNYWDLQTLFSNANDELDFRYNGSSKMIIDNSGNVGIGTTSPNYVLNTNYNANSTFTNAASDFTQMWQNSGTNALGVALSDDLVARLVTNNSYEFAIGSSTTEQLRIDGGGRVGIGTTNPQEKLHIEGSVLIDAYEQGAEEGIFFRQGFSSSNKYNMGIMTYAHNGSSNDGITIGAYNGFSVCTGNNTRSERFRVNSTGNVLVNTTSAFSSGKLDVQGGTNNAVEAMGVKNNAGGSYNVMIKFFTSSGAVGRIDWDNTGSSMNFTNLSDARLKEVTGEARGLDLITKLNPVKYYFKDNDWESEGLVAQEVEQAYQDLGDTPVGVRPPEDEDDYYHLSTGHFVVNLIKAVKEQQEQIEQLKGRIEELENG